MKKDVYAAVTASILAQVDEAGEWKPCWQRGAGMPVNGVSGHRYRGINVLMLWIAGLEFGQQRWATYKQWQAAGCQVKAGSKSTMVVLFKDLVFNAGTDDEKHTRLARAFNVFNADQVEGERAKAPYTLTLNPEQRQARADKIIEATGARIEVGGSQPCYVPAIDTIRMPAFDQFHSAEGYYSTTFHELAHWTGAKSRLDRDLKTRFDKAAYAMEELVAELAACFCAADCGMDPVARPDHAAYLKSWRDVLKADNAAIVTAAAAAQRAADLILGTHTAAVIEEAA